MQTQEQEEHKRAIVEAQDILLAAATHGKQGSDAAMHAYDYLQEQLQAEV